LEGGRFFVAEAVEVEEGAEEAGDALAVEGGGR
jgi:hypothetical protein